LEVTQPFGNDVMSSPSGLVDSSSASCWEIFPFFAMTASTVLRRWRARSG
jgi:hypothetical protein